MGDNMCSKDAYNHTPIKRKIITKECESCGAEFQTKKYSTGTKRFCSGKCRSENHKKLTQSYKDCPNCGKTFLSNHNARKFCSNECRESSIASAPYLIHSRDDFKCVYCGLSSIEDGVKLHIDHIHPRSKGGEDVAGNLVTSCSNCNTSKNDRELPSELVDRIFCHVKDLNKKNSIPDSKQVKIWGK
jgi:ribosomal protein S27AE